MRADPIVSWEAISMRWASLLSLTVFAVTTCSAPASAVEWRRFVIPQTGASVDIPISIFSEAGEQPKGVAEVLLRDVGGRTQRAPEGGDALRSACLPSCRW